MKIGTNLPELEGATEWLNGTLSKTELIGAPTLVHFWSVSCGICSEQMPQVRGWHTNLASQGLKVVGIHMPRSESDTDLQKVREAVADYKLEHPIAVDNGYTIVDAFENKYVPAFYLFDAEGHLRQYVAGENGAAMLERAITRTLERAREASEG
jgi:thiol-disulfide isomerase/thioredoxin